MEWIREIPTKFVGGFLEGSGGDLGFFCLVGVIFLAEFANLSQCATERLSFLAAPLPQPVYLAINGEVEQDFEGVAIEDDFDLKLFHFTNVTVAVSYGHVK